MSPVVGRDPAGLNASRTTIEGPRTAGKKVLAVFGVLG
jgi:hypothetical protein